MSTWLVQTLAVAAGLAVLAALAGLWSRTGARTRHALWLLVLLKLMMPPLVIVNWAEAPPAPEMALAPLPTPTPAMLPAPELLPSVEPAPIPSDVPEPQLEPFTPPPAASLPPPSPAPEPSPASPLAPVEGVLVVEIPFIDVPPEPAHPDVPAFVPITPASEPIDWTEWIVPALLATWLIGSLALIARQSYRLLRFRRQLAREARENIFADVPEWLLLELADAARLLNVASPRVTRTALVDTPLVWCLGRPTLLLPDVLIDSLGRDAWRGILRHELAHLKRRDHWIARLELLGEFAWWWNPLFWLARVQIHKYAELCCDAWVIALDSDTPGRHAYAMALLSVCEHLSKPRPTPTLGLALGMGVGETDVPGSRSARTLERRLRMILEEPPARRTSRLALLLILLLGLVVIPIWLHERDRALIREIALLTTSLRPSPAPSLDVLPPPEAQTTLPKPVPLQPELITNAVLKGVEKPASLAVGELGEPSPLPPANEPPIDRLASAPPISPPPSSDSPEDRAFRARTAFEKPTRLILAQQPLRSMIRALSKDTGLTFALDPRFKDHYEATVQFSGNGRPVRDALGTLLRPLDFVAVMDESGIVMITVDPAKPSPDVPLSLPASEKQDPSEKLSSRVGMNLKASPLGMALNSISRRTGVRFIMNLPTAARNAPSPALSAQTMPLSKALETLLTPHGLTYHVEGDAIRITALRVNSRPHSPEVPHDEALPAPAAAEAAPPPPGLPTEVAPPAAPPAPSASRPTGVESVPTPPSTRPNELPAAPPVAVNAPPPTVDSSPAPPPARPNELPAAPPVPVASPSPPPSVPPVGDSPPVDVSAMLQRPIDFDVENLPLSRIIRMIQADTGIDIICNPLVILNESKTATIQVKGAKLAAVLEMALSPHNLTFETLEKRIIIVPMTADKVAAAASTDAIPSLPPDPESKPVPPPMPGGDHRSVASPGQVPSTTVRNPLVPIPSPTRPSPSSPPVMKSSKPASPHPNSPFALDPGPERPTNRRSPFDLDTQPSRPKGEADDIPVLPGRRSPFDRDEPGSRVREGESREVLAIQIRRAKASLTTAEAQEYQARSELARWYREHTKQGGDEPVLEASPECEKLETQLKVALSQLELKKADVAEAEARLKEFDRRRARDLAKLKLSLSYARKVLELAQAERFRGLIPESDFRKAKQAVEELELQLKYDFPEEKPSQDDSSDERGPLLQPIDKPTSK